MLRHLVPPAIRPPFARYSHAVEIAAGARLLLVSGQLGISPDEVIPEGVEEQADLCLAAIDACLIEAGMARADIVRLNAYVTDRAHLPGYMAARDRFIADPPPASTLMIVSGFARPEFKVEIEALAARAD
ncbi:RidA family protein [Ancylobacter sp. FA202]|uniref:RidA family protein n=1 Tax=Ancylobacter sp. FA202 TaxID=1111106 RepID=UPI000381D1EC|nr:RidA family protein [Ancylobacter sp. FA202]